MQRPQGAPAAARPFAGADWRLRAACRFTDPDLFFPISDSGKGLEQTAKAKAVCAGCEVRRECLAFAVRARERHGIWGGMTEQERHSAEQKDQLKKATTAGDTPCTQDTEIPDRGPVKLNQGGAGCVAGAESISRAGGVAIVGPPRSGHELIEVLAMVARVACEQMTESALDAVRDSVRRASSLPARPGWECKATAYAEIFRLLADAAGAPGALTGATGLVRDLMLTVGPGADRLISNSWPRLLACLRVKDADGAAAEMEGHLRALYFMERLACRPDAPLHSPGTATKGA